MRLLLSLLLFACFGLAMPQISPAQLQMLKSMGYDLEDLKQFQGRKKKTKRTQNVDNNLSNENDDEKTMDKEYIIEQELLKFQQKNKKNNPFEVLKEEEDKIVFDGKKDKEELKAYGAMFFENKNPINPYSMPTPSSYPIASGDKLFLNVYGAKNENLSLEVDRNGNVTLPNMGEVKLLGLSFLEAKNLLKQKAKKAYPNSSSIVVGMEEFSPIQITLSGLAKHPGLLNLNSFSTIKDALNMSGGIQKGGSYRNIVLKRGGKAIKNFDLYKIIRYGKSDDISLQNGDVVLIKPALKSIKLQGAVNNEAIYELKNKESFKDLFAYASGFAPNANKKAITLKRYKNGRVKVYTLDQKALYSYKPQNGDEVHVYPVSDIAGEFVKISGNIVAEGVLGLPKDKKLSSLFKNQFKIFGKKAYFKEDTNFALASLKNSFGIRGFNLQDAIDGKSEVLLEPGDEIVIYKSDDIQEKAYIFADGDVIDDKHRKYLFHKGMSAYDLFGIVRFKYQVIKINKDGTKEYLLQEDGKSSDGKSSDGKSSDGKSSDGKSSDGKSSDESTFTKRVLVKVARSKLQVNRIENGKQISYTLLGKKELQTFKLKPFDEVRFFRFSRLNESQKVSISGEVFVPGEYYIDGQSSLKDLIKLAGGLTKKALFDRFELVRYDIVDSKRVRKVQTLNLSEALGQDLALRYDDEVKIFPIENWRNDKYVTIKGMVKFPGRYSIQEGERLASVIKRAGGFSQNAFLEGSVFTRVRVKQLQQKRLEEALSRLKSQAISMNLSTSGAGENAGEKMRMMDIVTRLEAEAKNKQPIGRISINLYHDLKRFEQSPYNITLEDKDELFVPLINDTVSVVGEVLNPNTFIYDNDLDVFAYIDKSGGLSDNADDDLIYVVKANGEARRYEDSFFWGSNTEIFKGDTIIVPLKIETISNLAFAKDVTSILYQLAVTAASLKTVGAL